MSTQMARSNPMRRSISDLRALCQGRVLDDSIEAGSEIRLNIDWDDHSRARRLEGHGWITDAQHDAGEGYYAKLTEVGVQLLLTWQGEQDHGNLNQLLDPEHGGGVDVFCDVAQSLDH